MSILQLALACSEPLSVHRVEIREAISSLFAVMVVARSPEPSLELGAIVGQPAALRVATGYRFSCDDGARRWAGVCSRVEQIHGLETAPSEVGLSTYLVQIVPILWLLTHRRNCRIFQHLSIPEIAGRVLEEWGIEPLWQLGDAYPRLEYRVQHGESDYDFLCRLLEEAGIAFAFADADEGSSQLVLCDAMHQGPPRSPIPFVDNPSDAGEREYITRVGFAHEVRPGAVAIRDHDFRRPALDLLGQSARAQDLEGSLEVFCFRPGAFLVEMPRRNEGTPAADDQGFARHDLRFGAARATLALEATRTGRRAVSYQTNAIDLRPGTVFSIEGHPSFEVDGAPLLVTELHIEATPGTEWIMRGRAVFASEPYRPPLSTPKPVVHGVESALVVGPRGQEIHTDELGRVRVQFPWDREGRSDEHSSCWIRVAQGWAGTGFGMFALPRVGQEVLVAYLGGDPDRPIVIGRVFNGTNPVPFKLPEHATQSGWRSSSTPGGEGFNELRFEDRSGSELVSLRAERDLSALVRQDEAITVGRHRVKVVGGDESARTEGRLVLYIGKDVHVTIEGDLRERVGGTRSLTVEGDQHQQVSGTAALEAGGAIHIKAGGALVLEGADVTLRGPGGFVRIDGSGVTIDGGAVKIKEGGAPGAGAGAHPALPVVPAGVELRAEPRRLPLMAFPPGVLPPMPAPPGGRGGGPLAPDEVTLCGIICICKDSKGSHAPSDCVTRRLRELDAASGGVSKLKAEVPYDMSKDPPTPIMSNNNPGRPTTGKPKGSRAPDVVVVKDPTKPPTQDNLEKVIEIKFPPDRFRGDQFKDYERIAGDAPLDTFTPERCGCPDRPPTPVPVRELAEVALLTLLLIFMILDDTLPGGQIDDAAIPPALARILSKLAPLLRGMPVLP